MSGGKSPSTWQVALASGGDCTPPATPAVWLRLTQISLRKNCDRSESGGEKAWGFHRSLVGGVVSTHGRSVTQTLRDCQSVAAPPLPHDHGLTDRRDTLLRSQRPATGFTPQRSNRHRNTHTAGGGGGDDAAVDVHPVQGVAAQPVGAGCPSMRENDSLVAFGITEVAPVLPDRVRHCIVAYPAA